MRGHTANELRDIADILAADGRTTLTPGVRVGIEDLSGRRLEQAQLSAPETSHLILFRAGDALFLTESSYILSGGVLYIVDYKRDPRIPRAGMWVEVYCHVERTTN